MIKRTFILAIVFMVLFAFVPPDNNNVLKTKIMILGSYHMGNPGADVFNMTADDVLSSHRQEEIEELVKNLLKFKPTHIALEIRSSQDSITNIHYQKYLEGEFALPANESYQIGFRLAKVSGSKKVYCVDEHGPFDFNKLMQFAVENGFGELVQEMTSKVQNHINEEEALLKTTPLPAYYKMINHPDIHKQSHDWHLKLLLIANNKEFAGAELMRDLYERNLKIMANIMAIKEEDPSARILIIYGNGHSAFFKSILSASNEFEVVESYDYLN